MLRLHLYDFDVLEDMGTKPESMAWPPIVRPFAEVDLELSVGL